MVPSSEDSKKLKRGLKDVSSLFRSGPAETVILPDAPLPSRKPLVLAAMDTTCPQASSSMVRLLQAKMIQKGLSCAMNSFVSFASESNGKSSPYTILDFDWTRTDYFEQAIPHVKKVVLWTDGSYESLTETFKIMKAIRPLNQWMEYYILYKGAASDPKASIFFETFSDLVSKRLGISLFWLGCLAISGPGAKIQEEKLAFEGLAFLKAS